MLVSEKRNRRNGDASRSVPGARGAGALRWTSESQKSYILVCKLLCTGGAVQVSVSSWDVNSDSSSGAPKLPPTRGISNSYSQEGHSLSIGRVLHEPT